MIRFREPDDQRSRSCRMQEGEETLLAYSLTSSKKLESNSAMMTIKEEEHTQLRERESSNNFNQDELINSSCCWKPEQEDASPARDSSFQQ